jgi:hypothetical protein
MSDIVKYFANKYTNLKGLDTRDINIEFFKVIAIYSRNHPEFKLARKKRESDQDIEAKKLIDAFVEGELTNEIRDRVFKVLNYVAGKSSKFFKRLSADVQPALLVFYMYILFLPVFPKQLLNYINKALGINKMYFENVIQTCNHDLLDDYNKTICSPKYGDDKLPTDSVFRLNKRLPVSTNDGFLALTSIAYKLSQGDKGTPTRLLF